MPFLRFLPISELHRRGGALASLVPWPQHFEFGLRGVVLPRLRVGRESAIHFLKWTCFNSIRHREV